MDATATDRRSHEEPLPRRHAILDYLPYLWSRVLFAGAASVAPTASSKAWLCFLILPALLLYPCLSFHLFEPDEGRYAEIPREMLARGDWVVPCLLGEPYLDKPPLFYWLVMASFRLFGAEIWSARLIPALAVHGCVLLTYFLGRRSLGSRAAFWGALALMLAPGFLSMGRLLILDGLLAFCVTLALLAAFEAIRGAAIRPGWWALSAFACGLGILTKGPIAVVLVLPPLLANRFLTRPTWRLSLRAWLGYAVLVAAVLLPWSVAIAVREPRFAAYFLWQHNVVRFLSPFDHIRPIWFYLPILLGGLLPATLLLGPFTRFLLSGSETDARAALSGAWLHAPRRRLVLVLLLALWLEAADVHSPGVSAAGTRARLLPDGQPLAATALVGGAADRRLRSARAHQLRRHALVRSVPFAARQHRSNPSLLWRCDDTGDLLPAQLRFGRLLPGPGRSAQLSQQGNADADRRVSSATAGR